MATLIDSYTEGNLADGINLASTAYVGAGQSFTCGVAGLVIDSLKFYLTKAGSPTGNATAKLYSHTGTFGSTGKPDALLATGSVLDVSTLTGSWALKEFTFTGVERVGLTNGTNYFIVLEYSGGDGSNYVSFATGTSGKNGNATRKSGSTWSEYSQDGIYYVYGEAAAAGTSKNALLLGCG